MGTCSPPCPGGTGKALPPVDIATLLLHANPGLSGDALRRAVQNGVAIALAESSGHPGACNYYTANGAVQNVYGLWQISTIHGTGTTPCDPATAAGLFWQLSSNGTDYHAWDSNVPALARPTVIANMPAAIIAYRRAAVGIAGEAVGVANTIAGGLFNTMGGGLCKDKDGNDIGGLAGIVCAVQFFVRFFTSPNTWLRAGEVLAGGILVLFGLWVLFSQTKAGQSVNAGAGSAAKVAAVA